MARTLTVSVRVRLAFLTVQPRRANIWEKGGLRTSWLSLFETEVSTDEEILDDPLRINKGPWGGAVEHSRLA